MKHECIYRHHVCLHHVCVYWYYVSRNAVEVLQPDEILTQSLRGVQDLTALWWWSLLQGFVVTALNVVVLPVVEVLATYERHQTTTSYLTVMVFKLTIFYFLNSFAVPIAVYSIEVQPEDWCALTSAF